MQYSQFRRNIPLLFALACVYLVASHIYRALTRLKKKDLQQTYFYLAASAIVVSALHGTSCLKIIVIITISYLIGRSTGGSYWNPFLTWTFNLLILFLNEYYKGYEFESIGLTMLVRIYNPCMVINTHMFNRISTKVFCLDGTYSLILVCFDLYPTTWIITGNLKSQGHNIIM